jgi:hypothetical protein
MSSGERRAPIPPIAPPVASIPADIRQSALESLRSREKKGYRAALATTGTMSAGPMTRSPSAKYPAAVVEKTATRMVSSRGITFRATVPNANGRPALATLPISDIAGGENGRPALLTSRVAM